MTTGSYVLLLARSGHWDEDQMKRIRAAVKAHHERNAILMEHRTCALVRVQGDPNGLVVLLFDLAETHHASAIERAHKETHPPPEVQRIEDIEPKNFPARLMIWIMRDILRREADRWQG